MLRKIQNSQSGRCVRVALIFMLAVASLPGSLVCAQNSGLASRNSQADEQTELVVFRLKYISANLAAEVLQTMLEGQPGMRLAGEDNNVIIQGTPTQLALVRKTLAQLDAPQDNNQQVVVFALQNAEAKSAAQLLQQIERDITIGIDVRTNSLIVRGARQTLESVESLLKRLDVKPEAEQISGTYTLELFWLMEVGDDVLASEVVAADPRIQQAVIALQSQGFSGMSQVGQVRVVVKSGGRFRVRSNEAAGRLDMEGNLLDTDDRQLELILNLDVERGEGEAASVMTQINVVPGHNVVIGIASVAQSARRSAFVVRIEK